MIEILKTSDSLCRAFLLRYVDDPLQAEIILEILIEGKDKLAQRNVARVIKYLICRMKLLEKDDIENETKIKSTTTFPGVNGVDEEFEVEIPKALSVRFLDLLMS